MTDYERDMRHWQNAPEGADLNGCNPMPNRKDYDERGNKIGTKYTSDGRVIDPYLVEIYGMEYAIKNANMTREEQITRRAGSIADGCIAHGAPWKEYYQGFTEGAKWADASPYQPSLPSNLDEAARHYLLNEHCSPLNEIMHQADVKAEMTYHKDIESAFNAGAEWMAGQGYTFETTMQNDDVDELVPTCPDMYNHGYSCGDKIIVQIRKK